VKSQDPTYARKKPRSSYAEMLRNIRMRIEFKVMRKTDIMVAVTSTQSGDGKTYISTNLASLYSMTGHPTLLIDMDIRKPDVHEKLGLEAPVGVTNYLIGDCSLDDIIIRHEGLGFDVIAAGTIPPNPGELIRCDKLQEMLAELRKRYTYVIIDPAQMGVVTYLYALAALFNVFLSYGMETAFFRYMNDGESDSTLNSMGVELSHISYSLTNNVLDRTIANIEIGGDTSIDSFVLKDGKVYDCAVRIVNISDKDVNVTLPDDFVYEKFLNTSPLKIPASSTNILTITRTKADTFLLSREELVLEVQE
jgi:capsular exopolysaccharide synthesis family protein